ncbi:N-acetyltransferase [Parapedobacter defluvii]|uniref:N-acetyltransferase n=1 Tax=Parapedobacter defluvii TaxID=2045106 RepID=A0ABQ1M1T8_9SPHI|nr:N-acetyltransferase [Parapedobacter defluvii]GGC33301.1 N-acetyltransferase [Parapedobacter defluvii]
MAAAISIRQETAADFAAVFDVNRLAFGQDNEARLVDALRANETAFVPELSIVAVIGAIVVGHILFTKITIRGSNGNLHGSLALAPMAVRPEHQKQGIGSQLVRKGLAVASGLGFQSVIVVGHEQYYPKFGFEPAEKWNIKAPFEVPSDAFMAIELIADGLRNVSGMVVYPAEFESV